MLRGSQTHAQQSRVAVIGWSDLLRRSPVVSLAIRMPITPPLVLDVLIAILPADYRISGSGASIM